MPKTIRNVYDECLSFEELLKAHKMARRGKREKREVIIFELNLEGELIKLVEELKHGKWTKGRFFCPFFCWFEKGAHLCKKYIISIVVTYKI